MKTANVLCTVVTFLWLSSVAFSQVTLDKAETQDIIKQLTSQPRKTWIAVGAIEATHQEYGAPKVTSSTTINAEITKAISTYEQDTNKRELTPELQKMALDAIPFNVRYKLSNQYTMTSHETVKYDGERFYWEVAVSSRTDTVKPDATLAGNYMTDDFKMAWNQRRIFAWDGQKYTTYAVSGGQATVDAAGMLPHAVNGPLTAGLIPWGNGKFSYDSLSAASVTATQNSLTAANSVQMSILHPDGSASELTLDPSKAYAVTSATLTGTSGIAVTYTLSGYTSVAGQWVPSSVTIERKNLSVNNAVPTSESWTNIKVTSTSTPSLSSFNVLVAMNDIVEYASPAMASTVLYTNSYEADTDEMLAERLAYGLAAGAVRENCATVALKHVAAGFGKSVTNAALAGLVGSGGATNLYDLKRFAQGLGLYSRVVRTDLAGLENLGAAKAILHIPGKNHFVVVDHVDAQSVWLVDLSSRKFYYDKSVYFFPMEWTEGTALLLSDRPISGQFTEIPDIAAKDLAGGTAYQCNTLIQESYWSGCTFDFEICQGYFVYWYERWGCGQAESGTCENKVFTRLQGSPCIPDPINDCTITGVWTYQNMSACQ